MWAEVLQFGGGDSIRVPPSPTLLFSFLRTNFLPLSRSRSLSLYVVLFYSLPSKTNHHRCFKKLSMSARQHRSCAPCSSIIKPGRERERKKKKERGWGYTTIIQIHHILLFLLFLCIIIIALFFFETSILAILSTAHDSFFFYLCLFVAQYTFTPKKHTTVSLCRIESCYAMLRFVSFFLCRYPLSLSLDTYLVDQPTFSFRYFAPRRNNGEHNKDKQPVVHRKDRFRLASTG